MILRRFGNKSNIAKKIIPHFPKHEIYIELFFGAGGMFFNNTKTRYSILNDLDDDVFNLYKTLLNNKDELKEQIIIMPISESLLKYWCKTQETDPMQKALRFLLLSNFTLLGGGTSLRIGVLNDKRLLIKNINKTFKDLENSIITNCDFRDVLKKTGFRGESEKQKTLVYLDPPYLETTNNYNAGDWSVKDTIDCFEIMASCGINCAMSEFDNETILNLANQYGMNIIHIGERKNIKNKRVEILITNYDNKQLKLF